MHALLLASLLLMSQEPEPAAPEREQEAGALGAVELQRAGEEQAKQLAELRRLRDLSEPLPDEATLQRVLGVPDLRLTTLRERANELRVRLREEPADQDAGPGEARGASLGDALTERLTLEVGVLERVLKSELLRGQQEVQALVDQEKKARERAEQEVRDAEAARERALAEARAAKSALVEGAFARAADAAGEQAAVAQLRASLHDETSAMLAAIRDEGEKATELLTAARALKGRSSQGDALLTRVVERQRAALEGIGLALERRTAVPPSAEDAERTERQAAEDRQRLATAPGSNESSELRRATEVLEQAVADMKAELALLELEGRERWYQVASRYLAVAALLDEAHLALLEKVTPETRSRLFGLSEEGVEQLGISVRHRLLSFRFHVTRRAYELRHFFTDISWVKATELFSSVAFSLLLVLASLWLWRRAPSLWERAKKNVLNNASSASTARLLGSWLNVSEAVAPRVYVIVMTLWLHDAVSAVGPEPELSLVVEVFVWFQTYQLAARLLHMLILRLARRRYSLTVHQKLRILRSVRLALRYGFLVAYGLSITEQLMGRGVLYAGARSLALFGAMPVVTALVQRWRADITTAYLAHWPDTRLARYVEQTREEWYGFFVAVAAFGAVSGHALAVLSRDFILGFEQSRRALAYLFRLRIERQAQKRGQPTADVEALPESVKEAFADGVPCGSGQLVDRFSEVPKVAAQIATFPQGKGSLLLTAPYGMGRTTWLERLAEELPAEVDVVTWRPTRRVASREALCAELAEALELDATAASGLAELAHALGGGPRTIIVDGLERLFLRSLDGYGGIEALLELLDLTRGRVFWLLSAPTTVYRHLCQTRRLDQYVPDLLSLGRWSENELRELIQKRQRATGVSVSFEDLLVREADDDRLPAQVVETEDGYIRLLWNFAEGNPRVAQLFWLRSLVKDPAGGLKVHLYSAPAPDDLETLGENERFALAAIFLHRALSPEEVARACRLPAPAVHAHVARGLEMGLYCRAQEGSDVVAISLPWWEATLRYLRRKNLH